ncbi:unnamed protein product [Trichobilharzia regenti]|nr:unnamed protein product [Trichobilharzia regenti]
MESDSLQGLTNCSNSPVHCTTPSINFHIQHLLNSNDDAVSQNSLKIKRGPAQKPITDDCNYPPGPGNKPQTHPINLISDYDLYYAMNHVKKTITTSYNETTPHITNPTNDHNSNNNNNNHLMGTISQLLHNYTPEKISLFLKFMQNFYSEVSDGGSPSEQQLQCLLKTKMMTVTTPTSPTIKCLDLRQDQHEKEGITTSKRTTTTMNSNELPNTYVVDDDTIRDQNRADLPPQMKTSEQQLQNMKILKHLMKDYVQMKDSVLKNQQQNEVNCSGFFPSTHNNDDVKYAQKAFELLTSECGTNNLLPFMLHNPGKLIKKNNHNNRKNQLLNWLCVCVIFSLL